MIDPNELARPLFQARVHRTPIVRLSASHKLSLTDAYEVQSAVVRMLTGQGDAPVGLKLGFTSRAKAREMGVDRPIAGVLTDSMAVADGGVVQTSALIQPRVEPELAFRLGPGGEEGDDLWVCPALEVIDSRFTDFDFEATDVIADNASCAAFVVGQWIRLPANEAGPCISDSEVALRRDGDVVREGRTSAILGDPVRALEMARSLATSHSLVSPREGILLAGAATQAVPLEPGHRYTASVLGLGSVSLAAR